MTNLSNQQVREADLTDWRILGPKLYARFGTGDFATAAAFVAAITEAAEELNHHPDVHLRYGRVDLELISHDADGLTDRDLQLARRISELAAERELEALPQALGMLELALDVVDRASVGPFWSALLTGSPDNVDGDDVVDPDGRYPLLWMQQTEPHEVPKQRFHLDLWLPADVVDERITAVVASGGVVVDNSEPAFTVLADVEGNKACICVSEGR